MSEFPLLLAAGADIIKVIVPLVLLVIWVLFQVLGQKGPKPDVPPAGNPRPKQPGGGGLREEIERFLQEAKQLQEQQQSPRDRELSGKSESNSEVERRKKQERQRRKEEKQREAARQRAKEIAGSSRRIQPEPEIIEDVTVVGGHSLADQVSRYMDSSKFVESASHLGEDVGQADERLAEHLHQAFDHHVGHLAAPQQAESKGAAAVHNVVSGGQIATMLRDPAMFRHAIVLNEIFTRPEHRWE